MKISLKDVATQDSRSIGFDYTINRSDEQVNFEYPFREPIRISGALSESSGMFRLELEVQAQIDTACARCLKPVAYQKVTDVSLILTRKVEQEEMDDILFIETDEVDIDGIALSELLLDMEMVALCREDCKGLCPKCGANLNDGACGCDKREIDPRLAKLAQFLK